MRQKLLRDRYLLPTETTERQMYERVARFVAKKDETYYQTLLKAMAEYYWLPNTPSLVNAGRPGAGGLSACYVLPVEDSLDGIYKTVWDAARVHKAFGGTGFNFSHLRERGALIKSTGGHACGPIKVMELLNTSAGVVSQGGKRDGANMGILNASHPDIHEFIRCKDSDNNLQHFNISVGLRDEDMRNDELLLEIAEHAWRTGDPGIIFLDRLNQGNTHLDTLPPIECTNPCGEQPLREYESCNLGSVNLSKFPEFRDGDTANLKDCIRLSVITLDNIIDLNSYPIPEIMEATLLTRKIGSGLMGWADWLIEAGVSYQSTEALSWIDRIGELYINTARQCSHERALQFGNYPAWGEHPPAETRNETVMTIAPTGTLSYLAGCSWGIEPVFDWKYERESESGKEMIDHPLYQTAKDHGLLGDVAYKVSPEWQVLHVAKWQRYADNAVSKTINLPASATIEDVLKIIQLAHKNKCKGITVYRDKSKAKQVVTTAVVGSTGPVRKQSTDPAVSDGHNVERFGTTLDFQTGCGRIHVTCNERDRDSGVPFEVYVLCDGGCPAMLEALGKVISKYVHDTRLTGGEQQTVARIVKTLKKVDCPSAIRNPKSQGKSCPDIIGKRMETVWLRVTKDGRVETGNTSSGRVKDVDSQATCPQCGAPATFGLGCRSGSCKVCGWSGCS